MEYEFRTDRLEWTWPAKIVDEDKAALLISDLVDGGWTTRFACVSMDSHSAYYISERPLLKSAPAGFFNVPEKG